MADANDMIHVAQRKLQQFIRKYGAGICKPKEGMVRKNGPQPHRAGMQDGFVTEAAQTLVAMDNLDLFSYDNIAEDREEGEDGGHRGLAVNDKVGDMVDLQAVGQVSDAGPAPVCMCDDDDLVASIYEFLCARELAFSASSNCSSPERRRLTVES